MSVTLTKNTPKPQSGYTPCACRDCMDTTVSSDMGKPELCSECETAGCSPWGGREPKALDGWFYECQRDDAYDDDSVGDAGTGHGSYEYHSGA